MNPYLIGIIISLAVYLIVSFIVGKKVKNANDFYVAGRNAPTLLITGSLIASFLGTGAYTGDLAEAFDGGFAPVLIICGILVVGYIVGSVLFGKYLRRSEVYTIPQFFGKRFNSRPLHILATVVAILSMSVYLLSCMQGIGTVMEQVTHIDYIWCIVIAMCVFTVITILAGSKGVLITDTIMFMFFTIVSIVCVGIIAHNSGGWFAALKNVTANEDVPGILNWGGGDNYLYKNPVENTIWAIFAGISWLGVTMVGPWQASRYLMAKNEQTVVRSTIGAAGVVLVVQFVVLIAGVFIRNVNPELASSSQAIIWAAQNMMPLVFGVLLLTGIIAAGMSSATTFLSLIGSSAANDVLEIKDQKKSLLISRVVILGVSIIITILAVWNPPQIFWIMQFGTTMIAAAYLPVAIASIWSKKVTKIAAFFGMLTGFIVNFSLKMYTLIAKVTLPIYLDPFFIALVANILVIVLITVFSKGPTKEEIVFREKLFIIPECEKDKKEIKKTKKFLIGGIASGFALAIIFVVLWVLPII